MPALRAARSAALTLTVLGGCAGPAPTQESQAITMLGAATTLEDSMAFAFGPPFVDEASHEMLGDVLLSPGRFAEAAREFHAALERAPGRVSVTRGLEQARTGR